MEEKMEMIVTALVILSTLLAIGGMVLLMKISNLTERVAQDEEKISLLYSHSKSTDQLIADLDRELGTYSIEWETSMSELRNILRNTNQALIRTGKAVRASQTEVKEEVEQFTTEEVRKPQQASEKATEAVVEVIEEDVANSGMDYIGVFELTAYEDTGNCCANGNYPTVGYTVACNTLPLGTRIYIEGYGEYVVEDTGGMGAGVIDIYLGDPSACVNFGRQSAAVYIIN